MSALTSLTPPPHPYVLQAAEQVIRGKKLTAETIYGFLNIGTNLRLDRRLGKIAECAAQQRQAEVMRVLTEERWEDAQHAYRQVKRQHAIQEKGKGSEFLKPGKTTYGYVTVRRLENGSYSVTMGDTCMVWGLETQVFCGDSLENVAQQMQTYFAQNGIAVA